MYDDEDALDIPEEEDTRPEMDFGTNAYELHTHAVVGESLAAAMERIGSTDSNVRELVTIIETMRQSMGDKDELIARWADDLEQGLALILLEAYAKPVQFAMRVIANMPEGREKDLQIDGMRVAHDALLRVTSMKNDGPANRYVVAAEHPASPYYEPEQSLGQVPPQDARRTP